MAGRVVPAITHMAFGDMDRAPTGGETALGHEVHRAALSGWGIEPGETAAFFDCYLPAAVGGFVIREIGLFDAAGDLVAIGRRSPGLPKTTIADGGGDDFTVRMDVFFEDLDTLVVQVSPIAGLTADNLDLYLHPNNLPLEGPAVSSPPGSPIERGQWIVAPNPTGLFAGMTHQIARWRGGQWRFEMPRAGRVATYWSGGRLVTLRFDGASWAEWLAGEMSPGPITHTPVRSLARDELLIRAPIVKTVHGAGADFPTLQAAFAWLSQYRITTTGAVTFQLAAGVGVSAAVYDGAANVVTFNHPDGQRVTVKGAAMTGAFRARAAWTCTGSGAAARAADGNANLAMLRARYATEIRCINGAYVDFQGAINVSDILFAGDGLVADGVYFRFGFASAQRISAHGFGARGIVIAAEYVGTSAMSGSGCGVCGITVEVSGSLAIEAGPALGMGCGSAGIRALSAGSIRCQAGATLHGCGNAGAGVIADKLSAVIALPGSTADTNGSSGWVATDSSLIQAEGSTGTANGNYGYFSDGLARIIANNANAGGNTVGGIRAQSGSVNTATGESGTLSPAANTIGNNNGINLQ